MITRKENLLTQPFLHKKYMQHRLKVNTALPRIDDGCPVNRNHVYLKCKKLQLEAERQSRIERDNFILLRHLNDIMTAKRIDNSWLCELPKFQHRVKLFHNRSSKVSSENTSPESQESNKQSKCVKENCIACNPSKFITPIKIPEARVPWEVKIERECRWPRNEHEKHDKKVFPEESKEKSVKIPEIRRSHLNRRRQKRVPSAGCEYQLTSIRPFHDHENSRCEEKNTLEQRPLTIVMKFPVMRK